MASTFNHPLKRIGSLSGKRKCEDLLSKQMIFLSVIKMMFVFFMRYIQYIHMSGMRKEFTNLKTLAAVPIISGHDLHTQHISKTLEN